MKSIAIVEMKARFSAVLAEVEAGEEVAITRHGRVVARLVPDAPLSAADAFRGFWSEQIDLVAPDDAPPTPVAAFD